MSPEVPSLAIAVDDAAPMPHAAVPTLRFLLRLERTGGSPIRSIALSTQIRIQAARRTYDEATRERLVELFGTPREWAAAAHSVFWTQTTTVVPEFDDVMHVELPVACTADFDIVVAKYFHAVREGMVPLVFLFTGSVFYIGDNSRLLAARLPWDREARYRLPLSTWDAMMSQFYPNSRWLRIDRETFDRLDVFRVRHVLPSWDRAIGMLLAEDQALALRMTQEPHVQGSGEK